MSSLNSNKLWHVICPTQEPFSEDALLMPSEVQGGAVLVAIAPEQATNRKMQQKVPEHWLPTSDIKAAAVTEGRMPAHLFYRVPNSNAKTSLPLQKCSYQFSLSSLAFLVNPPSAQPFSQKFSEVFELFSDMMPKQSQLTRVKGVRVYGKVQGCMAYPTLVAANKTQ